MHTTRTILVVVAATAGAIGLPSAASAAAPPVKWWWTMVVSPSNPNVLLLGTNDGVYRSSNAGRRWRPVGLPGVNTTSLVQAGNTLFAGGVRQPAKASPIINQHGAYVVPPGPAVLATSTDGGKTWSKLRPRGLPNIDVQALAVDPANQRTLYALLRTGALYRSTDHGRSFHLVAAKVAGTSYALTITQSHHFVAGDMTTGSYVSANGKTWHRTGFTDSKGGKMVMEYACQPTNPARILMTAYGVVVSTDSGKTWHPSLRSTVMFGPIAWAPSEPQMAYAIGWDHSIWRTKNAGKTWQKIS